jgi:aryl-alcohol dehydrogenase-like predicted oxidoreductase
MGASSSLLTNIDLDIYLSYPNKTEHVEKMMETLQNMDFKVIESSVMIQSRNEFSIAEISKHMETLIEKTKYIFICISKETIKSVTQIMEMNEIMDKYSYLQNKIIYIMMDQDYTPITNIELKSIVNNHVWYPIYDEDSLFYTTNKLLTLLMNK